MTIPGGQEFYSAMQAKAMQAVQSILKSNLYPIQYPSQGDFMWNYLNINQIFNESTFNYISADVLQGDVQGTAKLSPPGGFPNAYSEVINAMEYSLSKKNQDALAQAQSNASMQAGSIVTDYQNIFGTITDAQMATANVSNKYDYVISYILGSKWSGKGDTKPLSYSEMSKARNLNDLLPNMPASGDQVVTDVSIYLNLMQPVNALKDLVQNGSWTLRVMKSNTMKPDDQQNGGMKTVDPSTGNVSGVCQVGYNIASSVASINNDLKNLDRTISIGMTTSQASGGNVSVSVEGRVGFSIGSWLKFKTSTGATYDMSNASGTSSECIITMLWKGYSVVPMAPKAWQQATNVGWYYADPIAQAFKNIGKDVDGFKFVSLPSYDLRSFADGGNFGLLTNLLIANYPTIKITYKKADYKSFTQSWSEKVSGNLTLFGFINLGSFSQGAYGSTYEMGSDNSTFTLTFSASSQVTSVPLLQQTAYVIGGAVANPGATA